MKLRIKKGLDLKIAGAPASFKPCAVVKPAVVAVCPDDFPGLTPKTLVAAGDKVLRGAPLMCDKNHPEIKLISPVAGTVREVVRGERRKIMRIEVEAAEQDEAKTFDAYSYEIRNLLAESGLLAMMRRRPYDIIPNPDDKVRDIFVTALQSAPLESPYNYRANETALQLAAKELSKLTDGKVYVCYPAGADFPAIDGVELVEVEGPHPAGNAGVQIANIKPVNKGEVVWTLSFDTMLRIGLLVAEGEVKTDVAVTIAGPEVAEPCVVSSVMGAAMADLLKGRLADDGRHKRIISGNVLTGIAVSDGPDSFLRAPYNLVTVIAEGDDVDEFMGWASLSPAKMSTSPSFPFKFLTRLFKPDARLNGGRRAMIMSGQYDSLIPMDILPEYLIKSIIAKDIEKMEQLGIYEVAPEDFALAEYADTSKLPLQQIVRNGLDYIRKELE